MKIAPKKLLLLSLITIFVAAHALAQQIKPDETKRIELNQAYGKLPLSFEANQGQTDPQVKFLSRGNGYSLFLTATEAVLVLKKPAQDKLTEAGLPPSMALSDQREAPQSFLPATVLRMKLVGGNATAKIAGAGKLPGKSNYLIGIKSEPVQKAGITGGNWNVSGNVLPGAGPIRTLRISAYSNDFTALSGSGTLFELRMTRVSQATQGTQLIWAAPPDQFIFFQPKPDFGV